MVFISVIVVLGVYFSLSCVNILSEGPGAPNRCKQRIF